MRCILLLNLLLITHLVCGQTNSGPYRVGLCPGPPIAYQQLVSNVKKVTDTKQDKAMTQIMGYLKNWDAAAKLSRYRVEIKRLGTRETWVWKKAGDRKPSEFGLASVESTAGRGDGLRAGRPGDNQRCFFQDTTLAIDTLYIRRGEFAETVVPTLVIDGRAYSLPLSHNRAEWLLSASVLPGLAPGQYHTAIVKLGDEAPLSLTLYLLSPDERKQLVESVTNWASFESMNCQQLITRLSQYLDQNWGGKTCAGSALYAFAQRIALTRLLQSNHVACTP